ncbi:DinB family protein [Brevibacillus ginsengisoli]|uniref:DinB family protein n=1 Tax=Brevibacillus ginsengisoli TaxID=363854 RepID=UPI003CED312F
MTQIELIIWNLVEARRRSKEVWLSIPTEYADYRPDGEAMSCIELVRHVLESQHYYHHTILNRASLKEYTSPFDDRELTSIVDEIAFGEKHHQAFLEMIQTLTPQDLTEITIDRTDVGYIRGLGDFLLRVAYHEAVHTGQLLQYLRMIPIDRPMIWD